MLSLEPLELLDLKLFGSSGSADLATDPPTHLKPDQTLRHNGGSRSQQGSQPQIKIQCRRVAPSSSSISCLAANDVILPFAVTSAYMFVFRITFLCISRRQSLLLP